MKKTTVYGPPGTGKTTYILKRLEEDFKNYKPSEIAFVSFTNNGVDEGKWRAIEKFALKEKELPYFGTIHSLCFKALKMDRAQVIGKRHYRLFSEKLGINFCGHYTEDYSSPNDAYLHAVEMKIQNPEIHKRMIRDLNLDEGKYEYIETEMGRMKKQLNLSDFTDMLVNYLNHGESLPVKIAYIDEAQDLTKLQWDVIEKMFANADHVIVAGDDDQAVYEWAGADVSRFINFSNNKVMLDKSYRMPISVHAIAKNIVSKLRLRQEKILSPKNELGEIAWRNDFTEVPFIGGELVLARTKYILRETSRLLAEHGYWFSFKGKNSVEIGVLSAILEYKKFLQGEIDDLKPAYKGLFHVMSRDYDWYEVLNLSEYSVKYYKKLIETKGYVRDMIQLETFHGSKGAENSHVVMITDTSKRVEEMRSVYPDMELRCLFVGVTRSSNKLTVVMPSRQWHCPMDLLTL